jgi:membrane-bound lytic murein transglycosylase B
VVAPVAGPPDVDGRTDATILPRLDLDAVAATAERTGVPGRALAAYASATLQVNQERPGCNLSWITLAGIGWVESQHGSHGGSRLLPDGSVSEPIIGPPLDGGPGVRAIRDTDGGRYDGDATWDRAVGPMQFIPTTWARWGVDANGDGAADPQHIDDAALAAARYLCSHGGDLRESGPWVRAVRAYNHSDRYVREVLHAANVYADRANG